MADQLAEGGSCRRLLEMHREFRGAAERGSRVAIEWSENGTRSDVSRPQSVVVSINIGPMSLLGIDEAYRDLHGGRWRSE